MWSFVDWWRNLTTRELIYSTSLAEPLLSGHIPETSCQKTFGARLPVWSHWVWINQQTSSRDTYSLFFQVLWELRVFCTGTQQGEMQAKPLLPGTRQRRHEGSLGRGCMLVWNQRKYMWNDRYNESSTLKTHRHWKRHMPGIAFVEKATLLYEGVATSRQIDNGQETSCVWAIFCFEALMMN